MNEAPARIAVLASGRGSNLQALIDAIAQRRLAAKIVLVASDRADSKALRRAESAGIATLALDVKKFADRASFDAALFERVAAGNPDLVVLAGFMRIIEPAIVVRWQGRMINIHPSLLPKYRGLHTHRRALAAGDLEHGASVHLVTAELDRGPGIAQVRVPVLADDDEAALAARVLAREHALLVACVIAIIGGEIALDTHGRILYRDSVMPAPLALDANDALQPGM